MVALVDVCSSPPSPSPVVVVLVHLVGSGVGTLERIVGISVFYF